MSIKIGILVLNYNGLRHLKDFMPKAAFLRDRSDATLVVIDNASCDDSEHFIQSQYPWAVFIRNDANYGWGEGYNIGIKTLEAKGLQFTHYLFLNNDTEPSLDWLEKLKAAAETAPQDVAEIGCRAVFKEKRISESLFSLPPGAESVLLAYYVVPGTDGSTKITRSGERVTLDCTSPMATHTPPPIFLGESPTSEIFAWYVIQVYNPSENPLTLTLLDGLSAYAEDVNERLQRWVLSHRPDGRKSVILAPDQKAVVARILTRRDYDALPPLIQNSGIAINRAFEGYDLHAHELWDAPQDHGMIRGICGVAKLVRADVFHELGGFDPEYFMYYEDLDFSLRCAERGYRHQLVPEAILVHAHAGTSDARSMFFTRQVAWSLYYFHWRHAGLWRRLRTWVRWAVGAWDERRREPNPLARPFSIARLKFVRQIGEGYLTTKPQGRTHV